MKACTHYCGGALWLTKEIVENDNTIKARWAKCGTCTGDDACNILEEPPRCRPWPGTEGVRCGEWPKSDLRYRCAKGFNCYRGDKLAVCRAVAGVGAKCAENNDCIPTATCLYAKRECGPLRRLGESCFYDNQLWSEERCEEGLYCDTSPVGTGSCVEKK